MRTTRLFTGLIMVVAAFGTTMCGERGGPRIRVFPQEREQAGEAGEASGTVPGTSGRTNGGSGRGSGGSATGTSNGNSGGASGAGDGGQPSSGESGGTDATGTGGRDSGEGGAGAVQGNSGGSNNESGGSSSESGGSSSESGGSSSESGGSSSESGGSSSESGGSSGTSGGSAATGGSSASGGSATSGGSAGSATSGGSAGAAGLAGTAGSTGGSGTATACGEPTGCCAPTDPSCFDGCSADGHCCHPVLGARLACDFDLAITDTVCIDECTARSYGRGDCDSCLDPGDPPCSDPSWDDACEAPSGFAYCSDSTLGFRLSCFGASGGVEYQVVVCTCDATSTCVPTPCCDGSVPSCDAAACDADGAGACCSERRGVQTTCESHGGYETAQDTVCINECTGRSFGSFGCIECTNPSDPFCDADLAWAADCASNSGNPVFCSDRIRGYRLSCVEPEPGTGDVSIQSVCTCDAGRRN